MVPECFEMIRDSVVNDEQLQKIVLDTTSLLEYFKSRTNMKPPTMPKIRHLSIMVTNFSWLLLSTLTFHEFTAVQLGIITYIKLDAINH